MNEITFGPDPDWKTIRTYRTTCDNCNRFMRLQSEDAVWDDGTPVPPPEQNIDRLCFPCGKDALIERTRKQTPQQRQDKLNKALAMIERIQ